ncbi:hypothetical protein Rsub_09061 [Raphidocelis subcapitata]|uniref:Uncharacterized protein n=1 Tax=Raphidocelis subcapitata TaxID=307507 RepID=A0A2V0P8U4_9CHLO|nr:hypothetical protein Rsub_09061 [Raphidocelis subcapitata]|eukprot:GBF96266.1 hypothetical protein Rsub_09061 [Raphidocelis subcapitata]
MATKEGQAQPGPAPAAGAAGPEAVGLLGSGRTANPRRARGSGSGGSGLRLGPEASPLAAVGGTLAVAGVALLRLSGSHRRRVRELTAALAEANERAAAAGSTSGEADSLKNELQELKAAKEAFQQRIAELETLKEQLSATATGNAGDLEAARRRCAVAEAARTEAEERWRVAFEELMRTKRDLEDAKGELGLTRSQMISLERELEHSQKWLRNSEKRVEQAHYDYRTSRMGGHRGDDTYGAWDA